LDNPSRHFFAPLEPLLVDGAPAHANSGRILRGSLAPIWEWISRNLLPTMARDYVNEMNRLIAVDNLREAGRVTATFQTKVVKSLEGTLASSDGGDQARAKLAIYTASRTVYDDVTRMLCVLRARDTLAKFSEVLPTTIRKFDDPQVTKISGLLDAFGNKQADALPFALALVATRLKTPWQLIRLATKAAPSKSAAPPSAPGKFQPRHRQLPARELRPRPTWGRCAACQILAERVVGPAQSRRRWRSDWRADVQDRARVRRRHVAIWRRQ
jgi:hypothetical protein